MFLPILPLKDNREIYSKSREIYFENRVTIFVLYFLTYQIPTNELGPILSVVY